MSKSCYNSFIILTPLTLFDQCIIELSFLIWEEDWPCKWRACMIEADRVEFSHLGRRLTAQMESLYDRGSLSTDHGDTQIHSFLTARTTLLRSEIVLSIN
ncbi:4Fe-4S binding domain-containing protein [Sesbania bispinosa]|nr:4Fe-4S binding domain-containing protein [Sesbania bispinosa]